MLNYLIKLFIHKYYVFFAGLKIGAPIFNLLVHDLSKLIFPIEYGYYKWFLNKDNYPIYSINHHHKLNKHHWQYWVFLKENGDITFLDIPDKYIKEMVADWAGSGRAKNGYWDIKEWYNIQKNYILLNDNTVTKVEKLLENF